MRKGLCLLLSVSFLLTGCSYKSMSYYQAKLDALETLSRTPQLHSSKLVDGPIQGDYYFTYFPAMFSETKDLRESRHRYLDSQFFFMFKKHGLVPGEFLKAKYEIRYSYYTLPRPDGMFVQDFDLIISERGNGTYEKRVWAGGVKIDKATSGDISLYFTYFLGDILKGFPEPQNTTKQVLDEYRD